VFSSWMKGREKATGASDEHDPVGMLSLPVSQVRPFVRLLVQNSGPS
jgi:hypothetical protein